MKTTQYRLELVWTNVQRSLMFESSTPFMAIHLNETITLPHDGGRVVITGLRHFIGESDPDIIVHHILLHVEDVVTEG